MTTNNTTVATLENANVAVDASLVKTANDRLTKTMGADSLDALVASTTRRSLLLVDASGSMDDRIRTGDRKIDALRKVVRDLRETHPVPVAAFGTFGGIQLIDEVPEPQGGTPMGAAIRFAKDQGANHAVLVTDGCADSERDALNAAMDFGGVIDTFYIGDGTKANDRGAKLAERIAKMTGGVANLTDLGAPKQLTSKIAGLLGDGSTAL